METNKPWRYSHTQLDLWKLCKRRYYQKYILGIDEPTTDNMAAGTWLAQEPIETWIEQGDTPYKASLGWESVWANFLAEFGGGGDYDSPIFTIDLAKRILAAYQKSPVQGRVVEVERTYEVDLGGGLLYTSRPDLVVERKICPTNDGCGWPDLGAHITHRTTWDIKLKTFNQNRTGDTWNAKWDLLPWDDQCLGQAIGAGADSFGQIIFGVGKKDGTLVGPVYLEQPVNPVLADEWKKETWSECVLIEQYREHGEAWPKQQQGCRAFGRECPYLAACGFGFQTLDNEPRRD